MKTVFTSLFLLALLPSTFAHPANTLETRDSCPTCNPDPGQNKCDITTSCIMIPANLGGGDLCACRAGYRAADNTGNTDVQWRLPWDTQQGRVFVAPGTVCDTLCDQSQLGKDGCTEVTMKDTCA